MVITLDWTTLQIALVITIALIGLGLGWKYMAIWTIGMFFAALASDAVAPRLERIINRADELGMVVILGYFYFGQDERLRDEAAVLRATDDATNWLFDHNWRNVLVEVNNECNVRYDHAILKPDRVHELIQRVQQTQRNGRRFLVGTSYGGGTVSKENVVRASDFLLMHGNGVSNPKRIAEMVREWRTDTAKSRK